MRSRKALHAAVWLLAGIGTLALAADAWAKPKSKYKREARAGLVTAHSRYGVASITARTRPGQWGPEVRLPGGTWISCKLDCKNTLREETIDFWKEQENRLPSCGRC